MLLELLAGLVLWTGFSNDAALQATCAKVTLDVGLKARATPIEVVFWMKDHKYDVDWLYAVPMDILPNGKIDLQPTEFWLEEIKVQKNLKIRVDNRDYNFDLTGTKDLIDCGDVGD